jgi:hypothetical protein
MIEENRGKRIFITAVLIHAAGFGPFIIICIFISKAIGKDPLPITFGSLGLLLAAEDFGVCFIARQIPRAAKVLLICKAIFLIVLALLLFGLLQSEIFVFFGIAIFLFALAHFFYSLSRQAQERARSRL